MFTNQGKDDDNSSSSNSLYKEHIKDHYQNPRNQGYLATPTHQFSTSNSSCGDEIDLQLMIIDGEIKDVAYQVRGCAICTASISMLSEKLRGLSSVEASNIRPEEVLEMLGMEPNSGRVKCGLLSLDALHKAIDV